MQITRRRYPSRARADQIRSLNFGIVSLQNGLQIGLEFPTGHLGLQGSSEKQPFPVYIYSLLFQGVLIALLAPAIWGRQGCEQHPSEFFGPYRTTLNDDKVLLTEHGEGHADH
jgi:hypothetical protein